MFPSAGMADRIVNDMTRQKLHYFLQNIFNKLLRHNYKNIIISYNNNMNIVISYFNNFNIIKYFKNIIINFNVIIISQ